MPRPRSETAAPPAEKPFWNPVEIDPAPSAEIDRTASLMLVMPALLRVSVVSTVTGDGVSVLVRRKRDPVTTMSSSGAFAVVGNACVSSVGEVCSVVDVLALAGASCASPAVADNISAIGVTAASSIVFDEKREFFITVESPTRPDFLMLRKLSERLGPGLPILRLPWTMTGGWVSYPDA